jgi:hypothetical protein
MRAGQAALEKLDRAAGVLIEATIEVTLNGTSNGLDFHVGTTDHLQNANARTAIGRNHLYAGARPFMAVRDQRRRVVLNA